MKIALLFGQFVCPRLLDFNNIWTNSRGLTGSDLGVLRVAEEFVKLGHDVYLFTNQENQKEEYNGIKLFGIMDRFKIIDSTFHAIVSWCEPDVLRGLTETPVRMVSEQLNGFAWCESGFDNFVDIWTSPSTKHMEYQKSFNATDPSKWSVVPNGCDPEVYKGIEKVPGRMIWASSADRGLHWLLQEWPNIKYRAPEATLRVFYNFSFGTLLEYQKGGKSTNNPVTMETAQRARYMLEMMSRLEPMGVEYIGSVSRERINREMGEATMMAFPCSPTIFTEGFSVATLEACAAGSCPVISDADALGTIYKDVVPMIPSPVRKHMSTFTDLVVRGLTDKLYRDKINAKCMKFAENFTWAKIAKQYESLIISHPKMAK